MIMSKSKILTPATDLWDIYYNSYTYACYAGCGAIINRDQVSYTRGDIIKYSLNWDRSHVLSRKDGGHNDIENLRPMCQTCNRRMGAEHAFEYMKRTHKIPPIRDPAFENYQYDGPKIIPRKFNQREIRTLTVNRLSQLPIKGMIFAATGSGKTAMVIEGLGKHLPGSILLWITDRVHILESQFTDENIFSWRQAGFIDGVSILNKNHLKMSVEFPNTCIITTTMASARKYHEKITNDKRFIGVVFDECHCDVNGDESYDMLEKLAPKSQIMLGLTATPFVNARTTNLFGDGTKINYILDYSMMEAMRDGVIRVPKLKYVRVKSDVPGNPRFDNISNKGETIGHLSEIIFESVSRKGIIWCDTVSEAEKWHKYFQQNISDIEFVIDHSQVSAKNKDVFQRFVNARSDMVMIAVDMYRMGVDIRHLSFAGMISNGRHDVRVLLQSMGRITRLEDGDPSPVFVEFVVDDTPDNYAKTMREKLADYYQALGATADAKGQFRTRVNNLKCERGNVIIDSGNVSISFEFIGELNTLDLFQMDGKSLADWMSRRFGGKLSWDGIRTIFMERGIKEIEDARKFLEKCEDELPDLFRWWEVAKYQPVDWNDLFGIDMSPYYQTVEEARRAINRELLKLTLDDVLKDINYIYNNILRINDSRLPPNPVEAYGEKNIKDIITINYEDYY